MPGSSPTLAWFVTAHGFGHAARSAAVMAELAALLPALRLELFTTVPGWFFAESLAASFALHPVEVDVGLVQRTALEVDLEATVERVRSFLAWDRRAAELATLVERLGCRAVVSDIAPLGLAVAARAGLPAVLLENFTWDWIYRGYAPLSPQLAALADALSDRFQGADLHLQTAPVCCPSGSARTTAPVCRRSRTRPEVVRERLGVPATAPLVLLTTGGIPWQYRDLSALERHPEVFFVVPGAGPRAEVRGRLVALPHHSPHFHPDLVRAADAVVAKLGYSTVAEVYDAGCPLAFIPRPGFPESPVLARFAAAETPALELAADVLEDQRWLELLPELLALPRRPAGRATGAAAAAAAIAALLDGGSTR